MSVVEIKVGNSKYKIECENSQKEKLLQLSEKLNKKVKEISTSLRSTDEKTVLVISALMLEEELEEIRSTKKEDADITEKSDAASSIIHQKDIQNALSNNMENISQRIDTLANKLRSY